MDEEKFENTEIFFSKLNEIVEFCKKHFDGLYDEINCVEKISNDVNQYSKNLDNIEDESNDNSDDDNYFFFNVELGKNLICELECNLIIDGNIEICNYSFNDTHNDVNISYSGSIMTIIYKQKYRINLLMDDDILNNNSNIELVDNIIFVENERNKGLGTEGMKYLIDFLKKAKYKKIFGEIGGYDNLDQIIYFYKKNGFTVNEDFSIELILN